MGLFDSLFSAVKSGAEQLRLNLQINVKSSLKHQKLI